MMQEAKDQVKFYLHAKFALVLTVWAKITYILAGRGSAKTTMVTGPWIKHKADNLPRSSGGLVVQSFADGETKILPAIFISWEMMGMEMDKHYTYGRRPPADWEKPLTPVLDYSHMISFPNGSNCELISMHMRGSANGKSLQWVAIPEAKFMNENRLREEVIPILRGHVRHFGKSPFYGAMLFETDKFSPNISWLLAKKKLHDDELVKAIAYWQLQLNALNLKVKEVSHSQGYIYRRKITKIEEILSELRKNCVYYGEANAYDNIANLGESYIENMRLTLTDYEFRIAIMNEDPTRAENGFYPNRTEENLYNIEGDDDEMRPIGVALDYQASIIPLVSFQVNDRVIPGVKTLNFLDAIYVKQPMGFNDVVSNFCLKHRHRPCKQVIYVYDHTATGSRPGLKTMADEVKDAFIREGWQVIEVYSGKAPDHFVKYSQINGALAGTGNYKYMIRIHEHRCAVMTLSMDMAGTKELEGHTKKDKAKEKDKNFPQEQATHFSDVFDMIVHSVLVQEEYPEYVSEGIAGLR